MGCRTYRRRARLREPKPVEMDDDLLHLASVIAEYQLDNNAFAWFKLPWIDGYHAAWLCQATAKVISDEDQSPTMAAACQVIEASAKATSNLIELYESAGSLYQEFTYPKLNTDGARLLAAGLRCVQLKLANSHGGGAVYNEVLIPAFLALEPSKVEDLVLEARCRDAIGTTHQLQGNKDDRKRQAFTIAWKRGLYLAAYSIRPTWRYRGRKD